MTRYCLDWMLSDTSVLTANPMSATSYRMLLFTSAEIMVAVSRSAVPLPPGLHLHETDDLGIFKLLELS